MDPTIYAAELPLDPWATAAAWSGRSGTLLLHTQRPWHGSGRSALLIDPRWVLTARAGSPPVWEGDVPAPAPPALPAQELPQWFAAAWGRRDGQPVFAGVAGLLGYDLGPATWGVRAAAAPFELPDAWLAAYDGALLFGGRRPPTLVVADLAPWVPCTRPLRARWESLACALLQAQPPSDASPRRRQERNAGPSRVVGSQVEASGVSTPPGLDERWYREAFAQVQRHLRAGDAYQINLTGLVRFRTPGSAWQLFERQALTNPVPFAAYLRMTDATITCHSPERLLRLRGDLAETAPIKGTAAAGAAGALLASLKDRAEHVMIVDLARNDLGRACRYGTVEVAELMATLPLKHLVHLVSRVRGRVREQDRHRLLAELFPGGSITGAPKRSAMEIIARVEQCARGPYTGSIGFVDRAGNADWNIAIRTAVWQGEHAYFGCGGGVVLDSDCDRELAEAALKARSFSGSLQAAHPLHAPSLSEGPRPRP